MGEPLSRYGVVGIVSNVLAFLLFLVAFAGRRCRPTRQLVILEDSWKLLEAALTSMTEEAVVINDELLGQIDW